MLPIIKNGFLNALLYLMACVTLATFGYVSELIISKNLLSRTNTRKLVVVLCKFSINYCINHTNQHS